MPLLQVERLCKSFAAPGGKAVAAVADVSFAVERGQCFGLLGPNGAGKTTTLEIVEGLQSANSGSIRFAGAPRDHGFRQRVGILFQQTALPELLTVGECLRLFRGLYDSATRQADLTRLIADCALTDVLHRNHRALSGGQRQRLLLALALINDPDLIFLDEPTTGLDPQARQGFWSLVERLKERGKTLVLTTHYMEEAERLCECVAVIDRGRIIARGTPVELLRQHFSGVLFRLPAARADIESLRRLGAVVAIGQYFELEMSGIEAGLQRLTEARVPLADLQIRTPNLEDLFLKLTGHGLRD